MEITLCFLTSLSRSTKTSIDRGQFVIQVSRTLCLIFLCTYNFFPPRGAVRADLASKPLLRSASGNVSVNSTQYDALPKVDLDAEWESCSNVRRQNEYLRRLERAGGWWAYLQEFRCLLPYIAHHNGVRLQVYGTGMLLLMLFDRTLNILGPRLIGNTIDEISKKEATAADAWQGILCYIFVIKIPHDSIITPARRWMSTRLYYWCHGQLLCSSFSHVMGLSLGFHENKKTGEIQAAVEQAGGINHFLDQLIEASLPLLLEIAVASSYLYYLFDVNVGLILVATYVLYGVATYKGTRWCATERRRYRSTNRIGRNIFYESVANWLSTFYHNRQSYQRKRMRDVTAQEIREENYFYNLHLITTIMQSLILCLGYCAVLLRATSLAARGICSVGDIVTLLLYYPIFTGPLNRLAHAYDNISNVFVDAEPLLQIMQTTPTVVNAKGARNLVFNGGKVEYRNVSFSYDGKNTILKNLNFTIAPGSTVAFVGKTGSGKTTTCDKLLFRGYDITEGAILVDDQDIRSVTQESLRDILGIVRQEQSFSNDTVLEIVRLARVATTDEEVYQACKDASIHDQIITFPKSYHSRIGERGVKLSGGGRQRLAIAQLFLRDPKIVVLDEATSSVDNLTESEIQKSFARICKGRTTIVVAHRLSTVQHAGQIFVLDRGTIVERGTHEELLGSEGKYSCLWNKKKMIEELQEALTNCSSSLEPMEGLLGSDQPLINQSDDNRSDPNSHEDMLQFDGASGSKQADDSTETRTGIRKKIHDLKSKFSKIKSDQEGDDFDVDEGIDDNSPIKVLSPRVTDTDPSEGRPRRSLSLRRRSWDVYRKPSGAPVLLPQGQTQEPLIGRAATINTGTISSPVRSRRPSMLPQSPSREAALSSHPVLKRDETVDDPSTYQTPRSSIDGRGDGKRD